MRLRSPLIAVSLLAALAACTDRQPPTTRLDEVKAPALGPVVSRDDLSTGKVLVLGPAQRDGRDGHRLRSEIAKADGATIHRVDLRVHWVGAGMDHWKRARFRHADGRETALKLGPAQLAVGTCAAFLWVGCDHDEQVEAELPPDLLQEAARDGGEILVSMTGGRTYSAQLSPALVRAHLDEVAKRRK